MPLGGHAKLPPLAKSRPAWAWHVLSPQAPLCTCGELHCECDTPSPIRGVDQVAFHCFAGDCKNDTEYVEYAGKTIEVAHTTGAAVSALRFGANAASPRMTLIADGFWAEARDVPRANDAPPKLPMLPPGKMHDLKFWDGKSPHGVLHCDQRPHPSSASTSLRRAATASPRTSRSPSRSAKSARRGPARSTRSAPAPIRGSRRIPCLPRSSTSGADAVEGGPRGKESADAVCTFRRDDHRRGEDRNAHIPATLVALRASAECPQRRSTAVLRDRSTAGRLDQWPRGDGGWARRHHDGGGCLTDRPLSLVASGP